MIFSNYTPHAVLFHAMKVKFRSVCLRKTIASMLYSKEVNQISVSLGPYPGLFTEILIHAFEGISLVTHGK